MPTNKIVEAMRNPVRGDLPKDQLEKRILQFLGEQTMCSLSTCSGDVPRATPVEYYSDGMTLYISADPGVKLENLKKNARISVSICNNPKPDWHSERDWATVKSAQITGKPTLLVDGMPEYEKALKVYKWQIFTGACGLDTTKPNRQRTYVKVDPEKIEYMEFAMKLDGYGARQIWTKPKS